MECSEGIAECVKADRSLPFSACPVTHPAAAAAQMPSGAAGMPGFRSGISMVCRERMQR